MDKKQMAAVVSALLILSALIIWLFGIRGKQQVYWTSILFLSGSLAVIIAVHMLRILKLRPFWIYAAIAGLAVTLVIAYLLWPFTYSLEVANTKETAVVSSIIITDDKGELVFQDTTNKFQARLWKGIYRVTIISEGYIVQEMSIDNRAGLKLNRDISQTVQLQPEYIDVSSLSFLDPTGTIRLAPKIMALGMNVLGERVEDAYSQGSSIMYGDYILDISDENFRTNAELHGNRLYKAGMETQDLLLDPGDGFMILEEKDLEYIKNYLHDFIILTEDGRLSPEDMGFPMQFYLYKKDIVVSLGDMLFLLCLDETYKDKGQNMLFVPKAREFDKDGEAADFQDCYAAGLEGIIPDLIAGETVEDAVYQLLTGRETSYGFGIFRLNSKIRGIDIAFTFDIESGRYVPAAYDYALSPCQNPDYSLGLSDEELVCDDPALVAWMTPQDNNASYAQYPYPQVSGILGFREILSYSEKYGMPATHYIVKKDILAFEQLEPPLIGRTRTLLKDGLIEVGSHTRYHTHLGLVEEDAARREIIESKVFLEDYFDAEIHGFRAPYLSSTEDEYAAMVSAAGYDYYSQLDSFLGKVPGEGITHKSWSGGEYTAYLTPAEFKELMQDSNYIITLDHPWNIVYQDGRMLKADPDIAANLRAVILTAISNGGIPVLAKDIDLYKA